MKVFLAIALLLVSFGSRAEPCANADDQTRVTGVSQCLLTRHFGPLAAENLLVWLHGDVSSGGAANYHFSVAEGTTGTLAGQNVQSVALVRPGYPDGSGDSSSVDASHAGRSDHYTRENIAEVAAAVRRLKERYQAKRVTVVGHSGGAATAAIMLGMEPGLVDNAVLVACPCDLAAWRASRRGKEWSRSENPAMWTENVSAAARVVALTGSRDDNTAPDLARRYVDALRSRKVDARFVEVAGASHNDAFRSAEVTRAISELLQAPTQ